MFSSTKVHAGVHPGVLITLQKACSSHRFPMHQAPRPHPELERGPQASPDGLARKPAVQALCNGAVPSACQQTDDSVLGCNCQRPLRGAGRTPGRATAGAHKGQWPNVSNARRETARRRAAAAWMCTRTPGSAGGNAQDHSGGNKRTSARSTAACTTCSGTAARLAWVGGPMAHTRCAATGSDDPGGGGKACMELQPNVGVADKVSEQGIAMWYSAVLMPQNRNGTPPPPDGVDQERDTPTPGRTGTWRRRTGNTV